MVDGVDSVEGNPTILLPLRIVGLTFKMDGVDRTGCCTMYKGVDGNDCWYVVVIGRCTGCLVFRGRRL